MYDNLLTDKKSVKAGQLYVSETNKLLKPFCIYGNHYLLYYSSFQVWWISIMFGICLLDSGNIRP